MKIEVKGEKIISTLQHEFHERFPFLKIEFFLLGSANSKSAEKNRVPGNKTFGAFGNSSQKEPITITPSMTVAELEKSFLAKYRLSVQVFRQSGKAWLETTLTDNWTLQEQNEQGKALSS